MKRGEEDASDKNLLIERNSEVVKKSKLSMAAGKMANVEWYGVSYQQ